jgi:hypothetical protein
VKVSAEDQRGDLLLEVIACEENGYMMDWSGRILYRGSVGHRTKALEVLRKVIVESKSKEAHLS